MKVLNNIMGKGTEDISKKLGELFDSRNKTEYETYPAFVIIKYTKNTKTGRLVKQQMYGTLDTPILMYNECDEGDNVVKIQTRNNLFHQKQEDGFWTEVRGPVELQTNSKIVDAEKYIKHELGKRNTGTQLPKGENVVNMYVGKAAQDLIERLNYR